MHRPTVSRALAAALLPAVAALALVGCGSSDQPSGAGSQKSSSSSTTEKKLPTSQELFDQARTSALGAKSAHVAGTVTDDGKPMQIDLAGLLDGTAQKLEIGMGTGQKATVVSVGGKHYLTGSAEFWTKQAGAEAAKMFDGKYVLMPASQAKDFSDMTLKSLLTELFDDKDVKKIGSTGKVVSGRLDGDEVFILNDAAGAQNGQLYLSSDGKATLLKVVGPRDNPSQLTFSEWGSAKAVTAPDAGSVVKMPS